MTNLQENIHPVFDRITPRADKERILQQRARVIWMTGLSGSGKSTLAIALEKRLIREGYLVQVLDGDNIRTGISNNLGFSNQERMENIRRIAEVSKLFNQCGIITINAFVSPTNEIRDLARQIIGERDFLEVYINVPLEIAEKRDVKGLYRKARNGEISQFTGLDSLFEPPSNPFLEIRTDLLTPAQSVDILFNNLKDFIKY
jgi:adenylylsulfate kinase